MTAMTTMAGRRATTSDERVCRGKPYRRRLPRRTSVLAASIATAYELRRFCFSRAPSSSAVLTQRGRLAKHGTRLVTWSRSGPSPRRVCAMAPHAVALLPRRRPPGVGRHLRGGHSAVAWPAPSSPRVLAAARSFSFWTRVARIYGSYKVAQLHARLLRAQARARTLSPVPPSCAAPCAHALTRSRDAQGVDVAAVRERVWLPQHERAGKAMHELAVTLRCARTRFPASFLVSHTFRCRDVSSRDTAYSL